MNLTEDQLAIAWRKSAYAEGHRKKLPITYNQAACVKKRKLPGATVQMQDAYDRILKSVRDGNTCTNFVVIDTGFKRQFVHDRLRYLGRTGMIEKVGNQWRIKK